MNIPTKTFKVSEKLIEAFKLETDLRETLLIDELNNTPELLGLVRNYLFGRFTVYGLDDIMINEIEGFGGSFEVEYRIFEYNGCANLDAELEEQITVEFDINPDTSEITLTGEEIRERSTNDEF